MNSNETEEQPTMGPSESKIDGDLPRSGDRPDLDDQAATLDLSKYRTPELVDSIVALISIPKAAFKIVIVAVATALMVTFFFGCLYLFSGIGILGWLLLLAYSAAVGLGIGFLAGIVLVIHQALANIEGLIDLILNITSQASVDYGEISVGKTRRPTATELIQQIFSQVILPSLADAVVKSFGIFGKPINWVYCRVLTTAVKFVVKRTNQSEPEDRVESTPSTEPEPGLNSTAGSAYAEQIAGYATKAQKLVQSVGQKIRLIAMLPMYLFLGFGIFISSLPVILIRVLVVGFGGDSGGE